MTYYWECLGQQEAREWFSDLVFTSYIPRQYTRLWKQGSGKAGLFSMQTLLEVCLACLPKSVPSCWKASRWKLQAKSVRKKYWPNAFRDQSLRKTENEYVKKYSMHTCDCSMLCTFITHTQSLIWNTFLQDTISNFLNQTGQGKLKDSIIQPNDTSLFFLTVGILIASSL